MSWGIECHLSLEVVRYTCTALDLSLKIGQSNVRIVDQCQAKNSEQKSFIKLMDRFDLAHPVQL